MISGRYRLVVPSLLTLALFLVTSCSSLPLIGKKKEEKRDSVAAGGKTVTVEGMEKSKGVNPPKPETPAPAPARKPVPAPVPRDEAARTASAPSRPFYGAPLPFLQAGLKRKAVVLDFENKTTYTEEKIGEAVGKRFLDKLEATQRVATLDPSVLSEMLKKEGASFERLSDPQAMKRAYRSFGVQAFVFGTVTDVGLLSSKGSGASPEETSFATAKVEVKLVDASTGNLMKTFIGRSPIFGTKEAGEYSRSKAVLKAIDFALDELLDGFFRQLDFLEWTTTIARVEGDSVFINAGKFSGLRVGDTLEVYEPGREVIHPATKISLGWTTGQLKGAIRVSELFGVDAGVGKVVQGQGFTQDDVVKSSVK
jgi:hypothetical protein